MQRLMLEKTEALRFSRVSPKVFAFKTLSNDDVSIDVSYPPKLKMYRWGKECFIKIWLKSPKVSSSKKVVLLKGGRVTWLAEDAEFHFYPLNPTSQYELGGVEFEVILKKRPPSNKLVFRIETENLKFYYQPPLTPQEIDAGALRPDNVVGSYAVYHEIQDKFFKTEGEAEKYKTGKAFHIYRPKVTDANGNSVWANLDIDEAKGLLIVTIPEDFLDKAVYPVSVDPTFGYTVKGGSSKLYDTPIIIGSKYPLAVAGTATSISVYVTRWAYLPEAYSKCAVYDVNLHFLATSGIKYFAYGETYDGWLTYTLTTQPTLTPGNYWLCMHIDWDHVVYWDSGDPNQWLENTSPPYIGNPWPDPLVPTGYRNQKLSIYCTYTAAPTYTLTLNVDKTSGYVGDIFTFTGNLTQNGTAIAGATVTLYKDNVALSPSTTTDQYGNYAFQWVADTPGNHSFYAEAVW
jgi:hypothetical protein